MARHCLCIVWQWHQITSSHQITSNHITSHHITSCDFNACAENKWCILYIVYSIYSIYIYIYILLLHNCVSTSIDCVLCTHCVPYCASGKYQLCSAKGRRPMCYAEYIKFFTTEAPVYKRLQAACYNGPWAFGPWAMRNMPSNGMAWWHDDMMTWWHNGILRFLSVQSSSYVIRFNKFSSLNGWKLNCVWNISSVMWLSCSAAWLFVRI